MSAKPSHSFLREGPKGAAAVKVREEEGGVAEPVEEEGEREMGKVKVCQ